MGRRREVGEAVAVAEAAVAAVPAVGEEQAEAAGEGAAVACNFWDGICASARASSSRR
jgi:hypothetical protein